MATSYRRNDTTIKLNSAHLPLTALAWKSPALLIILIATSGLSLAVAVATFFASPELRKAPVFSQSTRDAQAYYRRCYAHNRLARPEASPHDVRVFCTQQMELYRLDNPD